MLLWSSSLKSSQKNYPVKRLWTPQQCGRGIEFGKSLAEEDLQKCTFLMTGMMTQISPL